MAAVRLAGCLLALRGAPGARGARAAEPAAARARAAAAARRQRERRRRACGTAAAPRAADAGGDGPWLVVGLGNPGGEYEGTRHNIGFDVLDSFAARHGLRFGRGGEGAGAAEGLTSAGRVRGRRVVLLKPTTFMNRSGAAVRAVMKYNKVRGPPPRPRGGGTAAAEPAA